MLKSLILTTALLVPNVLGFACAVDNAGIKYSQESALKFLDDHGISYKTNWCGSDRKRITCTSFDMINYYTLSAIAGFKKASGCDIFLTGGTELHGSVATDKHYNGFAVDIRTNTCINNYIKTKNGFTYSTSSGCDLYKSGSGLPAGVN
ncbi:hypothetical protein HK104_005032 [Borealophlyctis nickersoniae]|nr:hypothetical protein HK104_005032 [Borealophlyctis nickersoniae]